MNHTTYNCTVVNRRLPHLYDQLSTLLFLRSEPNGRFTFSTENAMTRFFWTFFYIGETL